jgi:hypothetical protein
MRKSVGCVGFLNRASQVRILPRAAPSSGHLVVRRRPRRQPTLETVYWCRRSGLSAPWGLGVRLTLDRLRRLTETCFGGRALRITAAIEAALLDALGGQGAVVVIEGCPGFGKTRLLAEALSRAEDEGIRTALGRADVDESVMPLSPLLSACFSY